MSLSKFLFFSPNETQMALARLLALVYITLIVGKTKRNFIRPMKDKV
jgi:hypothetical protein